MTVLELYKKLFGSCKNWNVIKFNIKLSCHLTHFKFSANLHIFIMKLILEGDLTSVIDVLKHLLINIS